jgi:hypothetical protein
MTGAIDATPMTPVPNHPYVTFRTGYDRMGRFWIQANCARCGDRWQHQCINPSRTNSWVYRYALEHGHGLRPVHQQEARR